MHFKDMELIVNVWNISFNLIILSNYILAYHAALTKKQRTEIQTAWQTNVIPLIVCTIAFGMGIDVINNI